MFLVENSGAAERRAIVEKHAEMDPVVGFLVAMVDFEWTLRRTILALGKRPTQEIRKCILSKCSGVDGYKDAWKEVIEGCEGAPTLVKLFSAEGVPSWTGDTNDNPGILQAFALRNKMVHGCEGAPGGSYLKPYLALLLSAVDVLQTFAESYGVNINGRVVRRVSRSRKLKRHVSLLDSFSGGDWMMLVRDQPQFAERCPWERLSGSDWMFLIRDSPQFADRCLWEKLSGEHVTGILVYQPQLASSELCRKLAEKDWVELLARKPELSRLCSCFEKFSGNDWVKILVRSPSLQEMLPQGLLTTEQWLRIIDSQPMLAERRSSEIGLNELLSSLTPSVWAKVLSIFPDWQNSCTCWGEMTDDDWQYLLPRQPRFLSRFSGFRNFSEDRWADMIGENQHLVEDYEQAGGKVRLGCHCKKVPESPNLEKLLDWDNLTVDEWIRVLMESPEFEAKATKQKVWEDLGDGDWVNLLIEQPQFAKYCKIWDEIDPDNWAGLLAHQPQFASKFKRWDEISDWADLLQEQPQFIDKCEILEELSAWDFACILSSQPQLLDEIEKRIC